MILKTDTALIIPPMCLISITGTVFTYKQKIHKMHYGEGEIKQKKLSIITYQQTQLIIGEKHTILVRYTVGRN